MDRRAALFINTAALIRLARRVLSLLSGTEEAGQAWPRVKKLPFREREREAN